MTQTSSDFSKTHGRKCGNCTMCCTLLGITELDKPRNVKCQHQIASGCGIYGKHPPVCQTFQCVWKESDPGNPLKHQDRPDRTGVVMFLPDSGPKALQVHVDPKRPDAWKKGKTGAFINKASYLLPVLITIGDKRKFLGTEDMLRQVQVRLGKEVGDK